MPDTNKNILYLSYDGLTDPLGQSQILPYIFVQIAAERKDVPTLMSMKAVSVFFILPAYSKKAVSPTKQGELMAMSIPVICYNQVDETGEIVRKYKSGEVISNFEDADFEHIGQNWEAHTALRPEAIRYGTTDYISLEKGVDKYPDLNRKILQNSSK